MKPKRDYTAISHDYIADVISGKIPACRFVKLACQRNLDDLARIPDEAWLYIYDPKKAHRICTAMELFEHVKGPKGGQKLILEPWQCFIITTLFGWVWKATGKRRFRKAHIEVPRGSGKSFIVSGIALFMLALDGESGAECFSAAVTREQAKIVFDSACQMAKRCPKFLEKYGVEVAAHDIHLTNDTLSVMRSLASEADSLEGKNPHFVVCDEIQAHKTRTLYEVLETAMAKRDNNLLLSIGTAGSDRLGIGYEVRGRVVEMLDKVYVDDSFWGCIWGLDPEDDWTTDESLQKANPNFGISVNPNTLREDHRRAIFTTHKQPSFQQKHMNIWTNADNALISAHDWQACYLPNLHIEDFREVPCVIGLDLSSKLDLCAVVWLFSKRHEDGKTHLYCFGRYWLPSETIEKSNNPKYEGWATEGYLQRVPGATNDFDVIEQELKDAASTYDVRSIVYDPWNAKMLADHLIKDGAPMVEIRPLVQNF
jgi:phage terminase large subunit-like protein